MRNPVPPPLYYTKACHNVPEHPVRLGFLCICVRSVENTPGFGMLRAVVGESPFADFPITAKIVASVGDMELVKASVGNKFLECPI